MFYISQQRPGILHKDEQNIDYVNRTKFIPKKARSHSTIGKYNQVFSFEGKSREENRKNQFRKFEWNTTRVYLYKS